MKAALVDNGSLETAAHAGLRTVAASIGKRAGVPVEAVSWRHSDRIPRGAIEGGPVWTLAPWIRARVSEGERRFVLIPFFISPQGEVGSSLRRDLEALSGELGGFDFSFTEGLAAGTALSEIVADRVRGAAAERGLRQPAVVVVDHGGPSRASAAVRNRVADEVRVRLGGTVGPLAAASMESPEGPGFDFNRPLLAEALAAPGFASGDVLIAPLFLLPGRHAGPEGDLAAIARKAQGRSPALRCPFTDLVGSHPMATEFLSRALIGALGAGSRP
jgi:sirohydrochlorin ferrochelatase